MHEAQIREAINGNRETQYQLGLIYCTSEDVNKAIFWLEKAKAQKDKRAADALNEIKMFLSKEHGEKQQRSK